MQSKCCFLLSMAILFFCAKHANAQGRINTVAGNGVSAYYGHGVPASTAQFKSPMGVAADTAGNVYIVDCNSQVVRKIDIATGLIYTIAGTPSSMGWNGDGGPATNAKLTQPHSVCVDKSGNVFISDGANNRIRKVNAATGVITKVAGNALLGGYSADGGLAVSSDLQTPEGIFVDDTGNLYIAERGYHRIRKVSATTGIITTIAGTGTLGFSGDGGPATSAQLNDPQSVVVTRNGDIYIADGLNHRVRKINGATGIITTYAGGAGTWGCSGMGGPAASAVLHEPTIICLDSAENLFISEPGMNVVLKVDRVTGIINNYAALCFTAGFFGDGGPAINAKLQFPFGICVDRYNNLYIGDVNNYRVRRATSEITNFTGGDVQILNLCLGTVSTPLDTLMRIVDYHAGLTERWSIISPPANGTLSGFPLSSTSTGGIFTPTGLFYNPTSGYSGTDSFKIQISNGFDSTVTKIVINIDPVPFSGTITGPSAVCTGSAITLSTTGIAGSWTSITGSASVSAGIVTGNFAGVDTVKYFVTNACGTSIASKVVTVNPNPSSIVGSTTVCQGSSITLTNLTPGGSWSSSIPSVATVGVSSGVVSGVTSGSVIITYLLPSGCFQTKFLIINPSAPITGTANVCQGQTTTLSNSLAGGTWSSSSSAIVGISSTGIVTGAISGTTVISYLLPSGCYSTAIITVNAVPGVITGAGMICNGTSITLSNSLSGGTWSSSSFSIASIGSLSGIMTGMSVGTVAITYMMPSGCYANVNTTVNTSPAPITGSATVCIGKSITMTDTTAGGTWSGSLPGIASVGSVNGKVTGISAGTTTISYTIANGCYSTKIISVNLCPAGVEPINITNADAIFPNPAHDAINVVLTEGITNVRISDYMGRVRFCKSYDGYTNIEVNIVDLPPGLYFMLVNNIYASRFVKQ